jgi:hypothetical protein
MPEEQVCEAFEASPPSRLLSLPFELRQRIFEHVFMSSASSVFPPQKPSTSTSLCGLIVRKSFCFGTETGN